MTEPASPPVPASPIAEAVAPGHVFEGPALELGGLLVDATSLGDVPIRIPLGMLNRHGLVAGATGTGKTKTLQLLALGGQGTGIPLRATMTSFGPTLLAKVLGLNATQESSLGLVLHYADAAGLPLLDLADLRAVVSFLTSDEGKADLKNLGGLSSSTAGVILRALIGFADPGGRRVLRRARVRYERPAAHRSRRQGGHLPGRAAQPPPSGGLLDVSDVAARRPLPRPSGARRPR